jgi:hypothetical protein
VTEQEHAVTVEQTLDWADGEYKFRVDWKALQAIESDTNSGPMALLLDMQAGRWRVEQIASIIRHALIGGGNPVDKVQSLIKTYVAGLPPEANLDLATGLLYMGVFGFRPNREEMVKTTVQAEG